MCMKLLTVVEKLGRYAYLWARHSLGSLSSYKVVIGEAENVKIIF